MSNTSNTNTQFSTGSSTSTRLPDACDMLRLARNELTCTEIDEIHQQMLTPEEHAAFTASTGESAFTATNLTKE